MRKGNMSEKLNQSYVPVEIDVKSPGNFGFISKEKARKNRIEAEMWVAERAVKKEDSMFHRGINERYNVNDLSQDAIIDEPNVEIVADSVDDASEVLSEDSVAKKEQIQNLVNGLNEALFKKEAEDDIEEKPQDKPKEEAEKKVEKKPLSFEESYQQLEDLSHRARILADIRSKIGDGSDADLNKKLNDEEIRFRNLYIHYEDKYADRFVDESAIERILNIAYSTDSSEIDEGFIDDLGLNEFDAGELTDKEREQVEAKIKKTKLLSKMRVFAQEISDHQGEDTVEYWRSVNNFQTEYEKVYGYISRSEKDGGLTDEYEVVKNSLIQLKSETGLNDGVFKSSKVEAVADNEVPAEADDVEGSDVSARSPKTGAGNRLFEIVTPGISVDEELLDTDDVEKLKSIESIIENNTVLKGLNDFIINLKNKKYSNQKEYNEAISAYQKKREIVNFELMKLTNNSPESDEEWSEIEDALSWIDSEFLSIKPEIAGKLNEQSLYEAVASRFNKRYSEAASKMKVGRSRDDLYVPDRMTYSDGKKETFKAYYRRIMKLNGSRIVALKAIASSVFLVEVED